MHIAIRTAPAALLTATLAIALGQSSPATATAYRDASAGAVCHAANGALAAKFTFNLNYLTNISNTDAYVICHLPMDDAAMTPDGVGKLTVHGLIPTAGTTVTCVAQVGAFYDSTNHLYSSSAKSDTAATLNSELYLSWDSVEVPRTSNFQVLSINCKLPPGTKLGLIERWEAPA
jgi:hypothetical protein